MNVTLGVYLLLFPSGFCGFLFVFKKTYFFFPTGMNIHPSSFAGQSFLVVAVGGLPLAIGQGWAAPNCAGALPGSLIASGSYNISCRHVKSHKTTLEDSEGVKGARPDVL